MRAGWQVVDDPVRKGAGGSVRVFNDQGKTLRVLRRATPGERRGNVVAAAGVLAGDLAPFGESLGVQNQAHGTPPAALRCAICVEGSVAGQASGRRQGQAGGGEEQHPTRLPAGVHRLHYRRKRGARSPKTGTRVAVLARLQVGLYLTWERR